MPAPTWSPAPPRTGSRSSPRCARSRPDSGRRPPSAFWPDSDIEPFATFVNEVPKHVATSTPLERPWNNASAIEGGLVEFVQDLKNSSGGDIGVHASISVTQTLLAAGVLDELRLAVAPAVVGHGKRLLDGVPAMSLEAIGSVATPSGYLLADYRIAR